MLRLHPSVKWGGWCLALLAGQDSERSKPERDGRVLVKRSCGVPLTCSVELKAGIVGKSNALDQWCAG